MEAALWILLLLNLFLFGVLLIAFRLRRLQKLGSTYHASPTTQKPGLLTIPGELRNEIYRLVLPHHEIIKIREGTSKEPALLAVCRQIHKEASYIYYCENRFHIDVKDWDYTVYKAFFHHVRTRRGITAFEQSASCYLNSGSLWNKPNLLSLLRFLHEDPYLRPFYYEPNVVYDKDDEEPPDPGITGAFGIVGSLSTLPWEKIEPVLDIYLREIATEEDGWEWECNCPK